MDRARSGWGMVAGLLAAAVAVGVGQLVAGIVAPDSSPVVAVGEASIDLTPPPVKDFAISAFGSNDKAVLVTGIRAVLAVFAAIVGALAVRKLWYGMAGLAGFTARTMSRKVMTDRSDRIYANERLVRFAEMEYAVPREQLIAAVREVRAMIHRKGFLISFPVEVRAVAAKRIDRLIQKPAAFALK